MAPHNKQLQGAPVEKPNQGVCRAYCPTTTAQNRPQSTSGVSGRIGASRKMAVPTLRGVFLHLRSAGVFVVMTWSSSSLRHDVLILAG